MENQINLNNQSQIQRGNFVNQDITEKPKINYWMVSTGVFALLFLATLIFYLWRNQPQQEKDITTEPTQQVTGRLTPTSIPTSMISPTPTIDITIGWKLYKNDTYKFEFKYPNDYLLRDRGLKIQNDDVYSPHQSLFIIKKTNEKVGQPPTIYLDIVTTQKTIKEFIDYEYAREIASWEEFKKESGLYQDVSNPSIDSIQDVKINYLVGKKVIRQRAPNAPNTKETQYLVKNNNTLYIFSVNYGTYNPDTKEDGTDEKNTLDLIFTTFKVNL